MNNSTEQVSYKVDKVSKNTGTEINRLKAQVELFWNKEVKIYCNYGLADGMTILECGSGPGYLMEKILKHFPTSQVTGLERDSYLIDVARAHLETSGLGRYKVCEGSVLEMEFPDNSFDFVIARLLLEHLPDPIGAAKEIRRVLKPGGKALIIDNDFEVHLETFPDIPELDQLYDAYCRARIHEGGNPKIGRELPGILRRANFINVNIDTIIAHSEIVGDEIFMKSEGSGIPAQLVEDGFLSSDVFDTIAGKWYDMFLQDNHSIFRQLFIVGGEKSQKASAVILETDEKETSSEMISSSRLLKSAEGKETGNMEEVFLANSVKDCEKKLTEIWCQVLGLDKIDSNDNFFDLGGNSLLAVRIVGFINKVFARELSVMQLFQFSTVSSLAKGIMDSGDGLEAQATETADDRAKKRREAIKKRKQKTMGK